MFIAVMLLIWLCPGNGTLIADEEVKLEKALEIA